MAVTFGFESLDLVVVLSAGITAINVPGGSFQPPSIALNWLVWT